jgi:hypothetical protein
MNEFDAVRPAFHVNIVGWTGQNESILNYLYNFMTARKIYVYPKSVEYFRRSMRTQWRYDLVYMPSLYALHVKNTQSACL